MQLFGTLRSASSISTGDPSDAPSVQLDRAADEVVRLDVEWFIARFIGSHPECADTLPITRLRGIARKKPVAVAAKSRRQTSA